MPSLVTSHCCFNIWAICLGLSGVDIHMWHFWELVMKSKDETVHRAIIWSCWQGQASYLCHPSLYCHYAVLFLFRCNFSQDLIRSISSHKEQISLLTLQVSLCQGVSLPHYGGNVGPYLQDGCQAGCTCHVLVPVSVCLLRCTSAPTSPPALELECKWHAGATWSGGSSAGAQTPTQLQGPLQTHIRSA